MRRFFKEMKEIIKLYGSTIAWAMFVTVAITFLWIGSVYYFNA